MLLLITASTAAFGGSWVRPAGGVYVKVGAAHFVGKTITAQGDFVGDALEAYGEVGLGAQWELDLSARAVRHQLGAAVEMGLQDLEALAKWGPGGATPIAILIGTRVSPYTRGLRGPGGADLITGFGVSRGYPWGWLDGRALHRLRVGGPSSAIRLSGQVGLKRPKSPIGGAVELAIQPAFARIADQPTGAPLPIEEALSVGAVGFVEVAAGFGLSVDAAWLPPFHNDGPGARIAGGLTWTR